MKGEQTAQEGDYAVLQDGDVLSDRIPEKWLEREVCERYGFCGREYEHIRSELNKHGKCRLEASIPSP